MMTLSKRGKGEKKRHMRDEEERPGLDGEKKREKIAVQRHKTSKIGSNYQLYR